MYYTALIPKAVACMTVDPAFVSVGLGLLP